MDCLVLTKCTNKINYIVHTQPIPDLMSVAPLTIPLSGSGTLYKGWLGVNSHLLGVMIIVHVPITHKMTRKKLTYVAWVCI